MLTVGTICQSSSLSDALTDKILTSASNNVFPQPHESFVGRGHLWHQSGKLSFARDVKWPIAEIENYERNSVSVRVKGRISLMISLLKSVGFKGHFSLYGRDSLTGEMDDSMDKREEWQRSLVWQWYVVSRRAIGNVSRENIAVAHYCNPYTAVI